MREDTRGWIDADKGHAWHPFTPQGAWTVEEHEPLVLVPDGPDEDKIPQIQADRKTRLVALAEWGKDYTAAADA